MSRARLGLAAIVAAAACGGGGKADDGEPRVAPPVVVVGEDAARAAPGLRGQVPRADAAMATTALRAPAATVIVGAEHYRIAPGRSSWAAIASIDPSAGESVLLPVALPAVVLGVLTSGAGDAVVAARAFREALAGAAPEPGAAGTAGTGRGWGGDDVVEVDVTYLAPADPTLPATTPLIITPPDATADLVVLALQRVGGVLAVEVDGAIQALRYAAPWTDPGWGGAPVPDEERAWDILLGPGAFVLDADDVATMRKVPVRAGALDGAIVQAGFDRFRAGLAAGAEPVVDVLITDGTTAQELVDALATLHAAGARRIGVGVATWRLPTFAADGQAEPGTR